MCFKPDKAARRAEAERRLADKRPERPGYTRSPRGNPETDHRDLDRSLERLEALVGR